MPKWTDSSRPVYTTSTDTADGSVAVARLQLELFGAAIANPQDLITVFGPTGKVFTLRYGSARSVADQSVIDAVVKLHKGALGSFEARHTEEKFDTVGRLVTRRIYSDNNAGTLAVKLEETIFAYVGATADLVTETRTRYGADGAQIDQIVYNYTKTMVGPDTFVRKILV